MGILSKIAEFTIEPIGRLLGRQVCYVIRCITNIKNLQARVAELKAAREAIENRVSVAETKGEKIQPDVKLWLRTVGEIIAKTDELLNEENQAKLKCLHGFCPNLAARHQLSRDSTKLLEEVDEHYNKREFSQVSCGNLRTEVLAITTGDYQAFPSRTEILKDIMDSLKDSDIPRIGICGIGGVGKTTLAKEIYKQASEDKTLFDDAVILLDVKSNPDPEAIQKKIVEKLGMEILPTETIEGRASRICARIESKKVLVILDDVQVKVDVELMGIPRLPTCKILVTCRTREVLSFDEMRADKVFQLDILSQDETRSLFMRMAGDIVVQNGRVREVAIQIAEKCGGLPLLVVTVASALKEKKKLQVWKDALRRLRSFDKEEFTKKAYLALEWSYNQLDDKELKPLFLLSGLLVTQNHINLEDLFRWGMGIGLFKNLETLEEARDSLDYLIEKLKESCLLSDSDRDGYVRMHDLVCDVARWIGYKDQNILSVEYRGELKEWPSNEFLSRCTIISLPYSHIPTFSEVPLECPALEMFDLYRKDDSVVVIPSNFFSKMQKLKVLDLTNMDMPSLPLSLQYLKTLQTLCLDQCKLGDIALLGQLSSLEILSMLSSNVKELPREIGQLTRLRLLDLSQCLQLKVIPPNVISTLGRLEDLRIRNSFDEWETEGKESNASISELKHLSRLSTLEIRIPNPDIIPANLFSRKLARYNILIGKTGNWRWGMAKVTLNTLKLNLANNNIIGLDQGLRSLLKICEDLSLGGSGVINIQQLDAKDLENIKHLQLWDNIDFTDTIINRKVIFPNLVELEVRRCGCLTSLFSFSTARSLVLLKRLNVFECELLQEIVSSTKECSEENMDNLFPNLDSVSIGYCHSLKQIFPASVARALQNLTSLSVSGCNGIEEIVGEEEEKEGVETIPPYFMFPKLTKLDLKYLPRLTCFYPKTHAFRWPLLTYLGMVRCDKVRTFGAEFSSISQEEQHEMNHVMAQPTFFSINQEWFLNLEQLELSDKDIWNGPPPASQLVFGKLNKITYRGNCALFSNQASFIFLQRLQNLQEIELSYNSCEEIFVNPGINGALPCVRTLSLYRLTSLLHLGNDNDSGSLIFPNLEFLMVDSCGRLKSIESSAISFRNLTTLSVTFCGGLEYLTSYSMAKSLVQLTTLEVKYCDEMVVFVSSGDDNADDAAGNEIVFGSLQRLRLAGLPSLQAFCSGNCTLKFPSSMTLVVSRCPVLKWKSSSDGVFLTVTAERNPDTSPEEPAA